MLVNSLILLPMYTLSKRQTHLGEDGDLVTTVAQWGTLQANAGSTESITNEERYRQRQGENYCFVCFTLHVNVLFGSQRDGHQRPGNGLRKYRSSKHPSTT